MGKKRQGKSRSQASKRALNAFEVADDEDSEFLNDESMLPQGSDNDMLSGNVAEEDDEEIDSDEALGSDDDWEEMISRKSKRNSKDDDSDSEIHVDVDDDPEEYDNVDSGELMSLSQIWDMDDGKKPSKTSDSDSGSESEDGDSESGLSDDESGLSDESDLSDDDNDEKLAKLRSIVAGNTKNAKKRLEINSSKEGEFSLPTGGKKISLADLTSSVSDSKGLNLVKGKKGSESSKTQKLAVPLPRRIQERHDRAAAYELTKDEVDKWKDTVATNREAEHLQFPINPPAPVQKITNYTPVAASTELEKKVETVLKDSALEDEKAISTFEELAPAKISKEELQRQLNERRLMRELALREEKRAKRIKKIKSKSYRRVHKKEREKQAELVEGESDEEDHNAKRAKERMTLKHKNTSSKWAKSIVDQGFTKDQETRAEMEEMLRRGEALREKIQGGGGRGDDDSDNEAYGSDEGDSDDELDKIDKSKVGKGIMGMKFMQEAEAAEREQNQKMLDADDQDIFEDDSSDAAEEPQNIGRRSFKPEADATKEEVEQEVEKAKREADEQPSMSRLVKKVDQQKKSQSEAKPGQSDDDDAVQDDSGENPWLTVENRKPLQTSKTVKEKRPRGVRKPKSQKKGAEKVIDMNQTLDIVDPLSEEGADRGSKGNKLMSFKQKDLVKRAFAGDDVVQEFQEAKRQKVEEEGDQEIDMTLPGWGSWGGAGADGDGGESKKRKYVKTIKGVKAEKRKDAKLKNVIVNEKVNKKVNKFAANAVPYPFETREQYERSLRMPIGQEWTSRDTHQRLTKPRVMVKQGTIVDPIKAPFK